MNNLIKGIIVIVTIVISTFVVCKQIENKKLKTNIKMLCSLLIIWIMLRIIKYEILKNANMIRLFWYLYYFPMLFSATIFLNISTWNNKNKKYIKILKNISLIGSSILFLLVLTNDIHKLVFKINYEIPTWEANYKYGIGYYIVFIWGFINIGYSIIEVIKDSKCLYKKQKFTILFTMFLLIFTYAIGYIIKIDLIKFYFRDFTIIYCIFFMLALIIIVYKEKYKATIEEQLYEEIETTIKDKTISINKKINEISKSQNKNKDLAYIKMLVSYCKRKSNLIVMQKNNNSYSEKELELFIKETIKDATNLGIYGDVKIANNFEIAIQTASMIYEYIYNLLEYCSNYNSTNMFINIEKIKDKININTIIDSKEKLDELEYNFEMSQYINKQQIKTKQIKEENFLNIVIEITINEVVVNREKQLTDKEIGKLIEMKSKVHDILGQRLSVVSSIVDNKNIDEDKINEIKPLLKNILDDLDNDKLIKPQDMLMQIIYTCELAGTKVYVVGELPKNYIKAITLVKIIRECSTNAIRHAKARNVYVKIIQKNKIEMIINNDGKQVKTFNEGDGIRGIRYRIEELNGSLEINNDSDFTIKISI